MQVMLSAIILSHNNAATIEKTLASLYFCDERILVDDNSTDGTLDLAKKYGVTVYTRELKGDFAAQRNFGLEKAKGPARNASSSSASVAGGEWVFFVDSDEVVSKHLADEVQKSLTIDCAGFYLKRQDWMFGSKILHGETNRVRLLRLAKKNAGTWRRPVHEVWDVKGTVGTLSEPLDHFPHPNVAQFVEDINVYSSLNAKYLYRNKTQAPLLHIILYPAAKFFVDYIWYGGFLDGTAGIVIALMMSMHSFLTRAKLWLLLHGHES